MKKKQTPTQTLLSNMYVPVKDKVFSNYITGQISFKVKNILRPKYNTIQYQKQQSLSQSFFSLIGKLVIKLRT